MTQQQLFPTPLNAEISQRLKEAGMMRAAEARAGHLHSLRLIAESIAKRNWDRRCDVDEIQSYLLVHDLNIPKGPHWGSIFKGSEWQFTGDRINSRLPSNHRREIKVWRLK